MKKFLLFMLFAAIVAVTFGQDKVITVEVESISKEAITVAVTLSFAAVVRWFEKRFLKKKYEARINKGE